MTPGEQEHLVRELAQPVSRAFYLTLRVLPDGVRVPVSLAYLLARAADTIADTAVLPPRRRLDLLLAFRGLLDAGSERGVLGELARSTAESGSAAERELLGRLPDALAVLDALPPADRDRVRSIVLQLTAGMEHDLRTFPAEDEGRVTALADAAELDAYTYMVAGCVGEFWTTVCVAHTPALRHWDVQAMARLGVRFGKALQLTNVLRDVPGDLRIGRCYLPADELLAAGLRPEELLRPSSAARARPVLVAGIRDALEHYRAAERYLLAIPRRCFRLRLGALWPVLIGLATLAHLAANERWLDPDRPSKISRARVYRTVAGSLPAVASDAALRAWIAGLRREVQRALAAGGSTPAGVA